MPLRLILHVPLAQIGKQLSFVGPKKHLVPHSFFMTVRSWVPGDILAQPLLESFFVLRLFVLLRLFVRSDIIIYPVIISYESTVHRR